MPRAPDLEYDIRARDRSGPAFQSAENRARAFNQTIAGAVPHLRAATVAAKAFAAAFVVGAVKEFTSSVERAVSDASKLQKIADKVSVDSESWQQLVFGLGQAGVAASDMERNFEQFAKRIGEAADGTGKLRKILQDGGVQLRDQNGAMRDQVSLLLDIADLVKNAASDQERMTIATEAFGRSGSDMVLALRGGADGVRELMARTIRAGGVIETELLRRAEGLDDTLDEASRTVETHLRRALLNLAPVMVSLKSEAAQMLDYFNGVAPAILAANQAAMNGGTKWFGMNIGNGIGNRLNPTASYGGEFGRYIAEKLMGGEPDAVANAVKKAVEEGVTTAKGDRTLLPHLSALEFSRRFAGAGQLPGKAGQPTTLPKVGAEGRSQAAKAAREQVSAYERVMEALRAESEMLGQNETQQRILIEQRRAGVSATSEQGQAIAALVTKIDEETQRLQELKDKQEAIRDAWQWLGTSALDSFFSIVDGSKKAEDALKELGIMILKAATYALLFNQGPLAGIFGKGIFGSIFGGARAIGGPTDPWKSYIVGENGPEVLRMGSKAGNVVPLAKTGANNNTRSAANGRPQRVEINVNVSGARGNTEIKEMVNQGVAAGLKQYDAKALPGRVVQVSKNPRVRG